MKILIIGGLGTIGNHVAKELKEKNEVIIAGRSGGDLKIDITNTDSIENGLKSLEKLDAIICIAGEAKWADFEKLTEEDYYIGIRSKLMGQVNLVRIGRKYLNPGGSITLSTGTLADNPVLKTTSAAMVNGAIHSFVRAVALELENGIRVNAVSLGLVQDSYEKYKAFFPGHSPVSMAKAVEAYTRSVFEEISGEIIRIYDE